MIQRLIDFLFDNIPAVLFVVFFVLIPLLKNLFKDKKDPGTRQEPDDLEEPYEEAPRTEPKRKAYFEHKTLEDVNPEELVERGEHAPTTRERMEQVRSHRNQPKKTTAYMAAEVEVVKRTSATSSEIVGTGSAHHQTVSRLKIALSGKDLREVMVAGEIIQPKYF